MRGKIALIRRLSLFCSDNEKIRRNLFLREYDGLDQGSHSQTLVHLASIPGFFDVVVLLALFISYDIRSAEDKSLVFVRLRNLEVSLNDSRPLRGIWIKLYNV